MKYTCNFSAYKHIKYIDLQISHWYNNTVPCLWRTSFNLTSCHCICYRSSTATAPSATAVSVKCSERKIRDDTARVNYITSAVGSMNGIRGTCLWGRKATKINGEETAICFARRISFRSANRSASFLRAIYIEIR